MKKMHRINITIFIDINLYTQDQSTTAFTGLIVTELAVSQ